MPLMLMLIFSDFSLFAAFASCFVDASAAIAAAAPLLPPMRQAMSMPCYDATSRVKDADILRVCVMLRVAADMMISARYYYAMLRAI